MTPTATACRITFKPTTLELWDLRGWLRSECRGDIGFAHHWPRILKARRAKTLACAVLNGQTLGFLYWTYGTDDSQIAAFEVLDVRQGFQGHHIGPALVAAVHHSLADPDACVSIITLYCNPPASLGFWQRQGFQLYPQYDPRSRRRHCHLYKPVLPVLQPRPPSVSDDSIELWCTHPDLGSSHAPDFVWGFAHAVSSSPAAPDIVVPAPSDARIRFTQQGTVVWDGPLQQSTATWHDDFLILSAPYERSLNPAFRVSCRLPGSQGS